MAKLKCDQVSIASVVFYKPLRDQLLATLVALQSKAAQGPQNGFTLQMVDEMNSLSSLLIYQDKAMHKDLVWYCGALDEWLENKGATTNTAATQHYPYPAMPTSLAAYYAAHPDEKLPFEVPPNV